MTTRRLSRDEFVPFAPDRGKVRVNHLSEYCTGDSASLIISRDDNAGISAHCFRCGARGYYSGTIHHQSATERRNRFAGGSVVSPKWGPPSDATTALPKVAREWLAKAGLQSSVTEAEGFLWGEEKSQLWIPVRQHCVTAFGPRLVGHVLRGFAPKSYLTRAMDRERFYGLYRCLPEDAQVGRSTDTIVLVEDVVSALRSSEICDTIALLGTSIPPAALSQMVKDGYKEAVVFLDGDNSIVKMQARKIAKSLPIPHRIVETGQDPKSYSSQALRKLIYE